MVTSMTPTVRSFSNTTLAKCFFGISLGSLVIYLALLLTARWDSSRGPYGIKTEDRQERNTANLFIGNSRRQSKFRGNRYVQLKEANVWNTNKHTSTQSAKYHGRDFLKDPKFTFDKRFKNPCWYEEETLKCLPYFFVIGVKKGGTKSTYWRTLRLSGVVPPAFNKEAQFFARHRFDDEKSDDIRMYAEMFKEVAIFIQNKSETEYFKANKINPFITGEASPSNLHLNSHWMYLPGNENLTEPKHVILDYIKHFIPDVKIIITFRDPISRLYSDYYHENKRNKLACPEQFHDIVVDGLRMYRDCFSKRTVRSCVYDPTYYNKTKMQMQLGIYYIYWEELLRVFPRNQILVLQNQDLSSAETYLKIQTFLELDTLPMSEIERIASGKYKKTARGQMLNETRTLLYVFYKPFNEKMAALMKDDTFLYKHDV